MFTVCPKCTLTLAVTANDLRVGQGYVRCGRCSNVFNALLKLSEAPAEGTGANLPELAQADPASTSQIHRAITAAAIDGGGAPAGTAAAPPSPRAAAGPSTPSTPARSAAAPPSAALSPASSVAPPSSAARISSARPAGTPTAGGVSAGRASPPVPPVAAKTPPGEATAGMPRQRGSDAAPEPRAAPAPVAGAAIAAPSTPTTPPSVAAPLSAAATISASATRQASTAASAASAASATPASMAAMAAAPAPAPTAARASANPSTTGRAAQSPSTSKGPVALSGDAPTKEGDADALDQFELVLQTLGLNADGEEDSPPETHGMEPGPLQTVENIVLEGDEVRQEVRQGDARLSDEPLDELDLFTRRLGIAAGDKPGTTPREADASPAGTPQTGSQPAPAEVRPALGRPAARRVRGAQGGRRSTDGPTSGDAALAAARAAGRDPGNPVADAEVLESPTHSAAASPSPDLDIPALRAAPPVQQRLWLAGAVALLVLLLAQLINHWRDALAASPTWGHSVTGLYATLGVPLQPRWDLSAYEVRQQGAESAGGPHAAIRVRFSLANHATRAQPVPLLRLTLLDRYGRRVAERNLTPADYWPKGRSVQSFLAADERVDTEVQVLDPSADSASFELDVCLPDNRGGIHCAADAAAPQAAGVPP